MMEFRGWLVSFLIPSSYLALAIFKEFNLPITSPLQQLFSKILRKSTPPPPLHWGSIFQQGPIEWKMRSPVPLVTVHTFGCLEGDRFDMFIPSRSSWNQTPSNLKIFTLPMGMSFRKSGGGSGIDLSIE